MKCTRFKNAIKTPGRILLGLATALGVAACDLDADGDYFLDADGGIEESAAYPDLRILDQAADFNGDGIRDLAVAGASSKVNIFMGYKIIGSTVTTLPTTPTKTLKAPRTLSTTFFGIGNCGDINKDGRDDLVIGDNVDDKIYVYLGSSTGLPSTPSQTINNPATSAGAFGFSTIGGVDFNKDGYADVVVGSPGANTTRGKVYVFNGGASGLASTPSITLTGTGETEANFGHALEVGYLNKDNYKDLIVTENFASTTALSAKGRVFVYLGTATGLNTTPVATLSCPDGDYKGFGKTVSIANDFDGDGIGDLVVGAFGVNSFDGRAYLFRGTATGVESTPSVTFKPTAGTKGYFGWNVLAIGNYNGDAYSDVVVGETDAQSLKGQAHVYYGGPLPFVDNTTKHKVIMGTHTGKGFFGTALSSYRMNGNYDTLVVGADAVNYGTGRVYHFYGSSTGLPAAPSKTMNGPNGTGTSFGLFFSR